MVVDFQRVASAKWALSAHALTAGEHFEVFPVEEEAGSCFVSLSD